ncbi:MAG: hypothetical protein ACJ76S_09910 [Solirubrobacteraceae bacterium]
MYEAARALREDDLERAGRADPARVRSHRRTVTITGRPDPAPPARRLHVVPPAGAPVASSRAPRLVQVKRRRPSRPPIERVASPPDRLAMWALLMALLLVAVTVLSSHS